MHITHIFDQKNNQFFFLGLLQETISFLGLITRFLILAKTLVIGQAWMYNRTTSQVPTCLSFIGVHPMAQCRFYSMVLATVLLPYCVLYNVTYGHLRSGARCRESNAADCLLVDGSSEPSFSLDDTVGYIHLPAQGWEAQDNLKWSNIVMRSNITYIHCTGNSA